jgi:hypothetical protein
MVEMMFITIVIASLASLVLIAKNLQVLAPEQVSVRK